MKTIDIKEIDENTFFHYTNINNLESILENGLEPRIGPNSSFVEKTKKIFFVKGEIGIIDIIDVWLKWITAKGRASKIKYILGTLYLRFPFRNEKIPNNIILRNLNDKSLRKKTYQYMKDTLENSVVLVLDLKENIDFSYDDIDEVKSRYYESLLKLLYTKKSNIKDKRVEYWNMHTFKNKKIVKEKISVLCKRKTINANIIIKTIIENNISYVKNNCEFLYEFYTFLTKTK